MFILDRPSLLLCGAMAGAYSIGGFEELTPVASDYTAAMKEKLLESGVLRQVNDRCSLSPALSECMSVIAAPQAILCLAQVQNGSNKQVFYLQKEHIVLLEQRRDQYGVTALPFLPLAVGAYAEFLGRFADEETVMLGQKPLPEVPATASEANSSFAFVADQQARHVLAEPDRCIRITGRAEQLAPLSILLLEKEQSVLRCGIEAQNVALWRTNKQDCVNSITLWFANAHAKAMEEV